MSAYLTNVTHVCALRGWSHAALTTETTATHPPSGAIIHTQSVYGEKHIADKTKELAGRMRSNFMRCGSDGVFVEEVEPGQHYLVVDGDWPATAKINLLEAGFSGVFEIGELNALAESLQRDVPEQGAEDK